ncbi:MAG: LpxI family protein [Deltaproteobacteria bacterium]|nr:LpxI family protein [Deltaproteobacteria bacterium]
MTNNKIGIIAGGGQFPLLFTKAAKNEGRQVVAVGHQGETGQELEGAVDSFCWVKLGQLGKIISFFKKNDVKETVFLGTITKVRIFKDVRPDLKGLTLWNKIDIKHDDAILKAIANALEDEGIKVLESTIYLRDLLFPKGILTRKRPNSKQIADIKFGWQVAKEIGRLDIGQCIVVRNRSVLAVEAIEGTDAAIRRGGSLGHKNAVVVKIKKPGQDFRFDLPAIGLETIKSMREVQAAVLAVEAGQSLLFDRREVIDQARKAGIVVVGISGSPDNLSLAP